MTDSLVAPFAARRDDNHDYNNYLHKNDSHPSHRPDNQYAFSVSQEEEEEGTSESMSPLFPPPPESHIPTSSSPSSHHHHLSTPLLWLFALNGATLALPTTPLLYIVNTQIQLPLHWMPLYGAITFLPYSFTPLYALWTTQRRRRRQKNKTIGLLLSVLLLLHAILLLLTICIVDSITACFIIGFLRGITSAWPDFLLNLIVVEQTQRLTATRLQVQATTARNIGACVAHVVATTSMMMKHLQGKRMVVGLLSLTAILNVGGSIYAWYHQVGRSETMMTTDQPPPPPQQQYENSDAERQGLTFEPKDWSEHLDHNRQQEQDEATITSSRQALFIMDTDDETASPSPSLWKCGSMTIVVLLQGCMILLALQGPLLSSHPCLVYILVVLIVILLIGAVCRASSSSSWSHTYSVGLFLILRNCTPTASFLMSSFVYQLFQTHVFVVQMLSLVDMGVLTLASWSYGVLFGKETQQQDQFYSIMVLTTILAGIVSLSQLVIVHVVPTMTSVVPQIMVVLLIQSVGTIVGEWKFLPDVVLATISSKTNNDDDDSSGSDRDRYERERIVDTSTARETENNRNPSSVDMVGVTYGSLIACIDFGGQLGSLLLGFLVNILGISRDNNWKNMDKLVVIGSAGTLLSVGWIYLLLLRKR